MGFLQAEILFDQDNYDQVIGAIYQLPCDSVWEEEGSIKAFFDESLISKERLEQHISEWKEGMISSFHISEMEDVNWNAKWEESFSPVEVSDICFIYADFHDKKAGFKHYVKIAPKMAFGTGHHETTYMMIENMDELSFENNKVLDLGCGSGILAVFAAQKNAKDIVAIDIEEASYENAIEHKEMNQVEYKVLCGGVEDTPPGPYDVVLANINRTVLLSYFENIEKMVAENGILLMSGILEQDASLIEEKYKSNFNIMSCNQKGKWLCYKMEKQTS